MKTPEQKLKQQRLDKIAKIQRMKPPEQWVAARDFALEVNPALQKEHLIHLQELEQVREEQERDDASSAGGTLRLDVSIPTTIFLAIRQFDPDFLMYDKRDKSKYKTKRSTNREVRKLMKIFPEYKIPRKG